MAFLSHDISMLRLFETFLENTPQLTLLLYVILRTNKAEPSQGEGAGTGEGLWAAGLSLKGRRDLVGCLQAVGPSRMLFFCLCLRFSSHSRLTSIASLIEYARGWTQSCVPHWPTLGLERVEAGGPL